MPSKCAVLVNSCDKYEDAWHPFFRLFDIMWPECPYDVYLNTETKECSEILHGGAVKTLHPSKTKCSWSKRLKDVLRQLDADYVITLLEDFFIMSPVRHDIIQQGLNIMDNDGNIMGIELYSNPHLDVPYERDFAEIDDTFMYCISTMAWIWRKEYLLSILRNENAWDFEWNENYNFIQKTNKYLSKHFVHPLMVYGYDSSIKVVKAVFFNVYKGQTLVDINYQDVINATSDLEAYYMLGGSDVTLKATASAYCLSPYIKSEFHIEFFAQQLNNYLYQIHKRLSFLLF